MTDSSYLNIDLEREQRCGFPEVILAQGKTTPWIIEAIQKLQAARQNIFVTRVDDNQALGLQQHFPAATQDRIACTFWLAVGPEKPKQGNVLIVTAGTGDLPVAQEALVTAQVLGANAELVADCGVAGLHRILAIRDKLNQADCVIVVAGMDGALPSVVGGLVSVPVIACPTSIGYGASFGGIAALLTMLNACSAGVAVVNIDAGFKAGYLAATMIRRMYHINGNNK